MSGFKRFVSYIYLYENEEKAGNVGFAKIELRGEECRIEVHLRGTYTNNVSCKIYLFTENEDFMQGVFLGACQIQNGKGDFVTVVKAREVNGTKLNFNQTNGLYLASEDERIFATRWTDGVRAPISARRFREWEQPAQERKENVSPKQPAEEAVKLKQPAEEKTAPQQKQHEKEVPQSQADASLIQDELENRTASTQPSDQTQNLSEESIQATEVPMHNIFPQFIWEEQWEALTKKRPVIKPFSDARISCVRIELKDLRELPRRYWYLGNNSFLLHGFFNYRYLVLGCMEKEEEKRWFLGVPGVYQNQERVMAAIFGFPEFVTEGEKEEPVNRFGYWYRLLDE